MALISSKHVALLFGMSLLGNAFSAYSVRAMRAETKKEISDMQARLEISQKAASAAAVSAARAAAESASRSNAVASAPAAVRPEIPPYSVVRGYSDSGPTSCLSTRDGLLIRIGEYWPEQQGFFVNVAGSFAKVQTQKGVKFVSLLRRLPEESKPIADAPKKGADDSV